MANRPGEVTFRSLMLTGCNVSGPTVMTRTETLRALGGYDERVRVEDYSMALQFTAAGHRVVNTGEVYTLYRRHGNNWTARPIFEDRWLIGQRFRQTPEYPGFVRQNLAGYFRWLAGDRKRDALRLLFSEPVAWTWRDVGVGLIKLLVPAPLLAWRRRRRSVP
jgi:alpha-1,3-rhamnosyltransferase